MQRAGALGVTAGEMMLFLLSTCAPIPQGIGTALGTETFFRTGWLPTTRLSRETFSRAHVAATLRPSGPPCQEYLQPARRNCLPSGNEYFINTYIQ